MQKGCIPGIMLRLGTDVYQLLICPETATSQCLAMTGDMSLFLMEKYTIIWS